MGNDKKINWEKIGVYIAALSLMIILFSEIIDLNRKTSKIEGYLIGRKEIIEEKK